MRIFLIVIDSFGIGAMPDAEKFGDIGSNTYGNIYEKTGVELKNLISLGLNNIDGVKNIRFANGRQIEPVQNALGAYGRLSEKTPAKDTTAGHYEIAGLVMEKPYGIYKTFPQEIVRAVEKETGVCFLGNEIASGTEIIQRLGEEHLKTKKPILYTSQDSVMQIAADISIIPLENLYEICEKARKIMVGDWAVGRIIARPFIHKDGKFIRTEDRRDYALQPPGKTMLDVLNEHGVHTVGVGKISDIFCGRGISESYHTGNNRVGIETTIRLTREVQSGLIFVNLVDTDMLYGHRNDVEGYASALLYFDDRLPSIIGGLKSDDILIVTADHGCDPTTASTDHSREYVPLLIFGKNIPGRNLGTLNGFDNIAKYICCSFGICGDSDIYDRLKGG